MAQALAEHAALALASVQTCPQAPQLLLSVTVLVQAVPQTVWPVGQAQTPLVQLWPVAQACPQVPQLLALVLRLASQPLLVTLSQSPKPALHRTIVQVPAAQPSAAALASAHTVPHDPQLPGSIAVLAQ